MPSARGNGRCLGTAAVRRDQSAVPTGLPLSLWQSPPLDCPGPLKLDAGERQKTPTRRPPPKAQVRWRPQVHTSDW